MAAPGSVYGFLTTLQKISPRNIENEVERDFKIAIVGKPDDRVRLRAELISDKATDLEREDAASYLREFDSVPGADAAAGFAFQMFPGGPNDPVGVRGSNGIPIVGKLNDVIPAMLTMRPDLTLALARRLLAFRIPACNRLILETSRVNASLAAITAVPSVIPWAGAFLPVISVADMVLLTKNQVMMVMGLAAAFGQKPSYPRQARELISTVGSGFGWRQLARELVGMVPGGVGLVLKATIAFSGTMTVGKGALYFYQWGKKPDKATIQADYEASQVEARAVVEELRSRVTESIEPASPMEPAPA